MRPTDHDCLTLNRRIDSGPRTDHGPLRLQRRLHPLAPIPHLRRERNDVRPRVLQQLSQ